MKLLDKVDEIAQEQGIERLFFIGDYFNRYGCYDNKKLYLATIKRLNRLREDYQCTFLVGNHDVAYILNRKYRKHYHVHSTYVKEACHEFFNSIRKNEGLYGYVLFGSFLFSHAGIKNDFGKSVYKELSLITKANEDLLEKALEDYSSVLLGRPLEWQNPFDDVTQVIGHTPVEDVVFIDQENGTQIICCDTWGIEYFLDYTMSTEDLISKRRALIKAGKQPDKYGKGTLLEIDIETSKITKHKVNRRQ